MKYTIEQIKQGDDELILRYQNLNQEVEHIIISRTYASEFRRRLKGEVFDE